MKPTAALFLALALFLPIASCATIITGSTDDVQILSNPPGAHFTTNSGHQGMTPSTISVPDDLTLEVDYTLAGYAPGHATLPPKMSGWIFGNIILGGLIGLAVDLISGSWRTHKGQVTVNLQAVSG